MSSCLFQEINEQAVSLRCKMTTSYVKYDCFFLFCVEVYGPGGSYNAFAGKDASRAIAKWSMSEGDLNDNLVRND